MTLDVREIIVSLSIESAVLPRLLSKLLPKVLSENERLGK